MTERWCLRCMQDVRWWEGGQVWVHEDSREPRCHPDRPDNPDEARPAPVGTRGTMRMNYRDVF